MEYVRQKPFRSSLWLTILLVVYVGIVGSLLQAGGITLESPLWVYLIPLCAFPLASVWCCIMAVRLVLQKRASWWLLIGVITSTAIASLVAFFATLIMIFSVVGFS